MKREDIPNEYDNLHLGDVLLKYEARLRGGKSVLQVGARPGDGWIEVFKCFQKHGYDTFDVLEIHQPNVDWLKRQNDFGIRKVVHGDIRLIDTYDELDDQYDIVIFWHGWEHCTRDETKVALPKVMARCKKAHIAGMPWGKWEQDDLKGNPHERHVHHWYPEQLEDLGFSECYTFNSSEKPAGADNHNVMYGVKYAGS